MGASFQLRHMAAETIRSRDEVAVIVRNVFRDQAGRTVEVLDNDQLHKLGMDSLDVTEALMKVDEATGVEQDKLGIDIEPATTVGAIIDGYWQALQKRMAAA